MSVVSVVSVLLLSVITVEVAATGLVDEPYTIVPSSLVISILLVLDALDIPIVRFVITSVPASVWNVNTSEVVVAAPGAMVMVPERSVPVVSVVVAPKVITEFIKNKIKKR